MTPIVIYITFGSPKGIGSSLLYHISCIALSLITHLRHANVYSRYSISSCLSLPWWATEAPGKIPVALAMWNQVGSECEWPAFLPSSNMLTRFMEAVLLIRTYAFFSRNVYVLWFLISALSGMVAYQLYVDTTQMLCAFPFYFQFLCLNGIIVLPFVKPPFVRNIYLQSSNDIDFYAG